MPGVRLALYWFVALGAPPKAPVKQVPLGASVPQVGPQWTICAGVVVYRTLLERVAICTVIYPGIPYILY